MPHKFPVKQEGSYTHPWGKTTYCSVVVKKFPSVEQTIECKHEGEGDCGKVVVEIMAYEGVHV